MSIRRRIIAPIESYLYRGIAKLVSLNATGQVRYSDGVFSFPSEIISERERGRCEARMRELARLFLYAGAFWSLFGLDLARTTLEVVLASFVCLLFVVLIWAGTELSIPNVVGWGDHPAADGGDADG